MYCLLPNCRFQHAVCRVGLSARLALALRPILPPQPPPLAVSLRPGSNTDPTQ